MKEPERKVLHTYTRKGRKMQQVVYLQKVNGKMTSKTRHEPAR